jgi:hypothetical protein
MAFPDGKYLARGVNASLGKTKNGGEQVAVEFELKDGPGVGQRITWFGSFANDKATEITVKALRNCGWDGDDLSNCLAWTPKTSSSSSRRRLMRARPARRSAG